MLLGSSGATYFGQIGNNFTKAGTGKEILIDGSYYEGTWDNDKYHGAECKLYQKKESTLGGFSERSSRMPFTQDTAQSVYIGGFDAGKKTGQGVLYEADKETVYEGEFGNDKKQGTGIIYSKNGEKLKGNFRNDLLEGQAEKLQDLSPRETMRKFQSLIKAKNYQRSANQTCIISAQPENNFIKTKKANNMMGSQ